MSIELEGLANPIAWSDERIDRLRTLFADGLTARQIGDELGCSRNAILGKIHRLGWWRSELELKQARGPKPGHDGARAARMISARTTRSPPPQPKPRKHVAGNKTIFELGLRDCRWPLGDAVTPARFFCGAQTLPSKPYCGKHYRISRGVRGRGS